MCSHAVPCSRELHARLLAARGFLYMITQELQAADGGGGGGGFEASEPGPSQVAPGWHRMCCAARLLACFGGALARRLARLSQAA